MSKAKVTVRSRNLGERTDVWRIEDVPDVAPLFRKYPSLDTIVFTFKDDSSVTYQQVD